MPKKDMICEKLGAKNKALAQGVKKGFITRNSQGKIVTKPDDRNLHAKSGWVQIKRFRSKKVTHVPFKREFLKHMRLSATTPEQVEARRSSSLISVEGSEVPAPLGGWEELAMPKALREHLKTAGFHAPTPIQSQMIPALLTGANCLGMAQTGSGKTLAFLLPMTIHVLAQSCDNVRNPIGLVMAPTRELIMQIASELDKFRIAACIRVGVAYGGQVPCATVGVGT